VHVRTCTRTCARSNKSRRRCALPT
jgi:hypothetical protein